MNKKKHKETCKYVTVNYNINKWFNPVYFFMDKKIKSKFRGFKFPIDEKKSIKN